MARQKRSKVEDANNTDRWMVSYADFVTLLFAFFVVMYSISSINEGKYKTLSTSL
ncbi:MAG: flagellar motor protein MotB, partial [Methylococcales bacterium]|nr:flagellar motor protein MotB [Methylococcales bacterium]